MTQQALSYYSTARKHGVTAGDAAKRAKWFTNAWTSQRLNQLAAANTCRALVPAGFWGNVGR